MIEMIEIEQVIQTTAAGTPLLIPILLLLFRLEKRLSKCMTELAETQTYSKSMRSDMNIIKNELIKKGLATTRSP